MKRHIIALLINFCFILSCSSDYKQNLSINQPEAISILKEPDHINIAVAQESQILDCPTDMINVQGNYCSKLEEHICIVTAKDKRFCLEFANNPVKCFGVEKEVNFCIDKEEFTNVVDGLIPIHNVNYQQAELMCAHVGKRMCMDYEWTQACEGPDHLPFPQGYKKGKVCNTDITRGIVKNKKLIDFAQGIDENPDCLSPYGVHNMSGNVDEIVRKSWGSKPDRTGLKGGYWAESRNMCRPMTHEHNDLYSDVQTGFRCCTERLNK